jgi:signal transduction histidine kinase
MLNAIQHTSMKMEKWPSGSGLLQVSSKWEPGEKRPVQVRFSDNGPGIHRKLWDRIFDLGFSTRPDGTGLGLYVARRLVESLGGRIALEESMVPLGTTFLVELPAMQP